MQLLFLKLRAFFWICWNCVIYCTPSSIKWILILDYFTCIFFAFLFFFYIFVLIFVKQTPVFLYLFGIWFLLTQKEWRISDFFGLLSFSDFILVFSLLNPSFLQGADSRTFPLFEKHPDKNHLRYEMSPIVAVLVVLISKFFDFKTAITEL